MWSSNSFESPTDWARRIGEQRAAVEAAARCALCEFRRHPSNSLDKRQCGASLLLLPQAFLLLERGRRESLGRMPRRSRSCKSLALCRLASARRSRVLPVQIPPITFHLCNRGGFRARNVGATSRGGKEKKRRCERAASPKGSCSELSLSLLSLLLSLTHTLARAPSPLSSQNQTLHSSRPGPRRRKTSPPASPSSTTSSRPSRGRRCARQSRPRARRSRAGSRRSSASRRSPRS